MGLKNIYKTLPLVKPMLLKTIISKLDKEFDVSAVKDEWQWLFDDLFVEKSLKSFRKQMHNTGLVIRS